MEEVVPKARLSSGHQIPLLGLGTVGHPLPPPEELTSVYLTAIEMGYRHFDTASIYTTEQPLGAAVAEALRRGAAKTREEFFITSKLWPSDGHYDRVLPALKQTLQNLELEYVDLYLIHWPLSLKKEAQRYPINKDEMVAMDIKGVWEAMEECVQLGLAKSIGVSNFSCKKLQDLLTTAKIPPAVNQVEMSIGWQQRKLVHFCKERGILVSAWSPLGAAGSMWGTPTIMSSPVLREIADAKGKSVAQVALRWLYEQEVSILVKSFNRKRMEENLDIFGWQLTEDELGKIGQIPQSRAFPGELFVSPQGPFKTIEELWDGEI